MVELPQNPGVDNRTVLLVAAGIIGFLVVFLVVLLAIFPNLTHRPLPPLAQFPAPSVMTDERTQRIELERAQYQRLSGSNGTMRIEDAMAAIAAKGATAYDPIGAAAQ